MNPTLEERVIKLMSIETDIPTSDIALDAHLHNDLGMDSLDIMNLLMATSDEFNIKQMPEDNLQHIVTVRQFINCIAQYTQLGASRNN